MIGIISRLFGNLIIASCIFSLILFMLSMAIVLRLLPKLFPLIRKGLGGFFILSYRLYAMILARLAPYIFHHLGSDILTGLPRVIACILISMILGLTLFWITNLVASTWIMILMCLHGLIIGLAWDEIAIPGGFQMGARIE